MIELNESFSEDVTVLNFTGFGGDCKFEITDLKTPGSELDYDTVTLYINGEVYDAATSKITNWSGYSADPVALFEQVLNAYLRDDNTEYTFTDDWKIFDSYKAMAETKDGLVTLLPQYDGFDIIFYNLDLATDENKYYMYNDNFLMLNNANAIVTDEEFFFTQAYDEDTEAIVNGTKKAKFTGENWDLYVAEYY